MDRASEASPLQSAEGAWSCPWLGFRPRAQTLLWSPSHPQQLQSNIKEVRSGAGTRPCLRGLSLIHGNWHGWRVREGGREAACTPPIPLPHGLEQNQDRQESEGSEAPLWADTWFCHPAAVKGHSEPQCLHLQNGHRATLALYTCREKERCSYGRGAGWTEGLRRWCCRQLTLVPS